MDKTLFDQIIAALLPEMDDPAARKALVESGLYGSALLQKIQWDGAARPFTVRLVRQLAEYGEIAPGQPALVALLAEVRGQVGTDRQTEIDVLSVRLQTPAAASVVLESPKVTLTADLYVFISYARPQQPLAEQIETYLQAAGVRVFRDTSEIREGANWDMTIEQALRDCQRMVLLLSPDSMPYRKEVHREWFYFDQKRKPIYPLYVADCDLHSRIYAYNYIDARSDLKTALERLLKELGRDFDLPNTSTGADTIGVFETAAVETRSLPEALQALLDAVRDPEGGVVLSLDQATAIKDHKPRDVTEYRLGRIAEWSLPRYALDNRFVNLTLLLDKGENDPQRWQSADQQRFHNLRDLLGQVSDTVLVLLGAPGSGKSTLLRRLQLDHSIDRLRDGEAALSLFQPLNGYRPRADGVLLEPRDWLAERWHERYPDLPLLATALQAGNTLLLLDALNEMPHKSTAEYHERVGLWRDFAQTAANLGNRVLFTCRSLDYSASLSSPALRVPQVQVQPMTADQVQTFLQVYASAQAELIWRELDGSPQFSLFQTPYFLKLLCEQVAATRSVPRGRASLFTGFVRQVLEREIHSPLFQPDTLLTENDHRKLSQHRWRDAFDLPERGLLLPRLSQLAFTMQQQGLETEGAQVRIAYDEACDLLGHERNTDILKAGVALNILDEDLAQDEITFFHQLLQEFFAARKLAQEPIPMLVQVAWQVDQVTPTLEDTLAALADGDPLPPLPQTGWEETTLTAAPMTRDPNAFIRNLIPYNLPLAARCAAAPEVTIDPDLKRELQAALIARSQDFEQADLRARIAAGEALGLLGDPRFERHTGPHGDYLLPPLVTIPAGTYPIGDDDSSYDDEKPAHTVNLEAFQIGQFPVTNAEYALFIEAGGYEDEQWWDTDEALAWLHGASSAEGSKEQWRNNRKTLQGWSEDYIYDQVAQNRLTMEKAESWIEIRNMTDDEFEHQLEVAFPSDQMYRHPEFWHDSRFNNPAQPVVGICWYEARAYCNWLSAQTGDIYTLPNEAQFEATARGREGRFYPYGMIFDRMRGNTFESHIQCSTPVGIFDNVTPEGSFDLSGNAYTWTTSIYDPENFPYPFRVNDGRENLTGSGQRILRGCSWEGNSDVGRTVDRNNLHPAYRNGGYGLRICLPL